MASTNTLIEFLYRALDAQLGVVIETNDVLRLQQKLYAARREALNPDFASLVFKPSSTQPQNHLWIIKKVSKE